MENRKTIKHLNSKAWYRAIKIVYILAGSVFFVLTITLSFSREFNTLDISNSKIICQYGNDKQFLVKDIFNKNEISTILPKYLDNKGGKLSKRIFAETILKSCEIDINNIPIETLTSVGGVVSFESLYSFKKEYRIDWLSLLTYLTGIIIFFEIIRRVFYYIFFGTIKPQKY